MRETAADSPPRKAAGCPKGRPMKAVTQTGSALSASHIWCGVKGVACLGGRRAAGQGQRQVGGAAVGGRPCFFLFSCAAHMHGKRLADTKLSPVQHGQTNGCEPCGSGWAVLALYRARLRPKRRGPQRGIDDAQGGALAYSSALSRTCSLPNALFLPVRARGVSHACAVCKLW